MLDRTLTTPIMHDNIITSIDMVGKLIASFCIIHLWEPI